VINDLTGILLPEKDVDGLADAVKRVLGDKSLREKLTRQAIDYSRKTFATKSAGRSAI